jgi:hypothetical protein
MVPCDTVKYLNFEYGEYDRWSISDPLNYSWSNMETNFGRWPDDQWASVHKVYTVFIYLVLFPLSFGNFIIFLKGGWCT